MLKLNVMNEVKYTRLLGTNANGVMSNDIELMDNKRKKDPDKARLANTRLSARDDFQITSYNAWRKEKKDRRDGDLMAAA